MFYPEPEQSQGRQGSEDDTAQDDGVRVIADQPTPPQEDWLQGAEDNTAAPFGRHPAHRLCVLVNS